MANGSGRSTPIWPAAAAVVSLFMVAPTNTPCCHERASKHNGTVDERRPPKMMALIGTPSGFSHSGSITGHCDAGAAKREFGCAAFTPLCGCHSRRSHDVARLGGSSVMPSHHTSPSSVSATLVKIVLARSASMALWFVLCDVPGATPKKPASGLMAYRRPFLKRIHAMSSPTHSIFQPGSVGFIMAKFVLPHADGNAAAT
mmetsp:Transcript_43756/g.107427  ORF Transcript_43756/g.107427 Transcript_43756/m.107427 type:complete len:201 (+) Transcript_43756:607-1209(+)